MGLIEQWCGYCKQQLADGGGYYWYKEVPYHLYCFLDKIAKKLKL